MDPFKRATLRVPGQSYPDDATVHAEIPCKPCQLPTPTYVPQPTPKSCWAASTTMIVSAHDLVTHTIDEVLQKGAWKGTAAPNPGVPTLQNLRTYLNAGIPNTGEFPAFLQQLGITIEPGHSLTPAGICALLSNHGPLGADISSGPTDTHVIVIYGIDYDESTGCQIVYHDPAGANGAESEMSFTDFNTKYDGAASSEVHLYYFP